MASIVHYKFKSQKDFDTITFDGMFISVGDLKRQIVDKKGLARDQACELLLTNAQSNEGECAGNDERVVLGLCLLAPRLFRPAALLPPGFHRD